MEEKKNNKKSKDKVNAKKELNKSKEKILKELNKSKDIISKEFKDNMSKVTKDIKVNTKKIVDDVKKTTKEDIIPKSKEIIKKTEEKLNEGIKTDKTKNDYFDKFIIRIKNVYKKVVDYIKNNKDKSIKILIIIITSIFMINLLITGDLFKPEIKKEYDEIINLQYKVKFNIEFYENLIFSKYDVEISSGGNYEELEHGKDKSFEFLLGEGEHTIYFTNSENSDVENEIKINVDSNMEVSYKISCHSNKIGIEKKYIDKDVELINNEIKLDFTKSKYVGKNYSEVIKEFEKLGFVNIIEKPKYDLTSSSKEFSGEVYNIKINSKDDFKKGDIVKATDEVVINYHLKEIDDPNKITAPHDTNSAKGKDYKEIEKSFKDAGFTNISLVEDSVYGVNGEVANAVSKININGYSFEKDNKVFNPDDKVEIKYYVIEKLGYGFAKGAFERYGESKYPYGFKCHWIVDNIASEQRADGSWYFKVGVTIENAYGNKRKTVAEGVVSGTNANPKVSQFYVSN